jgi:hypothetical protein
VQEGAKKELQERIQRSWTNQLVTADVNWRIPSNEETASNTFAEGKPDLTLSLRALATKLLALGNLQVVAEEINAVIDKAAEMPDFNIVTWRVGFTPEDMCCAPRAEGAREAWENARDDANQAADFSGLSLLNQAQLKWEQLVNARTKRTGSRRDLRQAAGNSALTQAGNLDLYLSAQGYSKRRQQVITKTCHLHFVAPGCNDGGGTNIHQKEDGVAAVKFMRQYLKEFNDKLPPTTTAAMAPIDTRACDGSRSRA